MFKVINLILVVFCTARAYLSGSQGKFETCALYMLGAIFNFIALVAQVYG